MFSVFRRFRLRGGPLAAGAFLLLSVGVAGGATVRAHETDCPRCKLPVVQDTATRDNEVALRYGRKRIEYRCVACALAEARTEYKNDLTILAPSEIKNKPVVLARKSGTWSALPADAVFVGHKVAHRHCHLGYRAFTTRAAFDAHVKANAKLLAGAKPLTLAELLEVAH
jgi:hypothetical protein